MAFAQGLRAAIPLMAAGAAAVIIGVKVIQKSPRMFGFFGPLGLAAAYGLAGLAASLKSPDGSVALWWAALYLSVPVILWGVVWVAHPLDQLGRLVSGTWVVVILAMIATAVVAALYLDLVDRTLHPTQFLQCKQVFWFDLTGGRLRGTGVGRYAAIAGLIAISGVWQGRRRPGWLVLLLISLILLLYTGARGAFGGFAAGASVMVLIYLVYAGKRTLLAVVLVTLVLVPLVWSTGAHSTFLGDCVFRSGPHVGFPASEVEPTASLDVPSSPKPAVPPTPVVAVIAATSVDVTGPAEPTAPVTAVEVPPATPADPRGSVLPTVPDPAVVVPPAATVDPQGSIEPTALAPAVIVAPKGEVSGSNPPVPKDSIDQVETPLITQDFLKFSGRTAVWVEGWRLFTASPLIGFGFHADRLLLGTHMHNSVLQALLQAGLIGAIPFVAAVIFGWVSFFRIVLKLAHIPVAQKHLVIQCGGVLAFLTMRSLPESTGAFFGVDWLILAPVLFYLHVVNYKQQPAEDDISHRRLER